MMRAVVFDKGALAIQERPVPQPGPDEVLARVLLAGICNTDLELFKGYMNFSGVPGHEFVGLVQAAPSAPHLVGKRIAADINLGCGSCPLCLQGDSRHCPGRRTLGIYAKDGVFAEFVTLPVANCHPVPDNVADQAAVFAEPLAAALEISRQIPIHPSMRLAILGDGKLGILIALGLRHLCPSLILIGKHPEKLAIVSRFNVTTALSPPPGRFDLVVEATGSPMGLLHALDLTRPEGTIVLKSTTTAPATLDLSRIVVDEITLMGSRCGDIGLALTYLKDNLVEPTGLVQAQYPFERFPEAFAAASQPGAMKILVRM